MGVCQNFSARGLPGGAGPLMQIWDSPNISETTRATKLKLKLQLDTALLAMGTKIFRYCRPGGAGPANVTFWTPNISESTKDRKFTLKGD